MCHMHNIDWEKHVTVTSEHFLIFRFFIIVFSVLGFLPSAALKKQISCQSEDFVAWPRFGTQKTCFVKNSTSITEPDFEMSGVFDLTITGVAFMDNNKILYLPVLISEIYPNLVTFSAVGSSFTSVSKENFKNLRKVKHLRLSRNMIENLNINSFEDLAQLQEIYLSIIWMRLFALKSFLNI